MKAATCKAEMFQRKTLFQSTPPVKAATIESALIDAIMAISIHAAREGGDSGVCALTGFYRISIHAAREGGDCHNFDRISH